MKYSRGIARKSQRTLTFPVNVGLVDEKSLVIDLNLRICVKASGNYVFEIV